MTDVHRCDAKHHDLGEQGLRNGIASASPSACRAFRQRGIQMNENDTVLNGRYTLTQRVAMPGVQPSELWEAIDGDGNVHTLKIITYAGDKPPSEIRRLWDNDLRVMYRLSSSAGANDQLVVMTDAGIDAAKSAMILVYEGQQHVTLVDMIGKRDGSDWLSFKKLKERHIRRELWRSLLQLAKGLKSLHDQNLIHRNVTPEAIWCRQGQGAESLRLSRFDWSTRIGHVANIYERNAWATPPELRQVGYSFASDWYGFGTTVVRCFYKVEHLNSQTADIAENLASAISRENPCNLEPLERDFIRAVTEPDRLNRLHRATDILERIERIIESLDFGQQGKRDDRRVLLHLDHRKPETTESARRAGFVVNPDDPFEGFDPDSPAHSVRLKDFVASQLRNATLGWSRDGGWFEVRGGSLFIRGNKWMDFGSSREQSWKAAKANLGNTSSLPEPVSANGFDDIRIEVEFMPREVNKKIGPGSGFIPWDNFAPRQEDAQGLGPDSENLRQFLHVSNQFEVLLRDAELFKYKVVSSAEAQGSTRITIAPVDENRPSRKFFKADKSMTDFIQQVLESGQRDCDKVLLTESDSLFLTGTSASVDNGRFDVAKEQWTVKDIDHENETLILFRQNAQGISPPPQAGYLRTLGHYGQIRLIERRKKSIDRLSSHAFLLRTLATPPFTSIDAGENELPWPQIEDGGTIDENKLASIKDILRMRPKYALQGPPGTGKSTLVAHLLRQILEDDPMAQILVTAKDHAAVDVLLDKVMRQAYEGTAKEQLPLAVRLNRRDGNDHAKEQSQELMQTALDAISNQAPATDACAKIQHEWRSLLQAWSSDGQSESVQALSNALVDLVRRGASITYCTTSSGDLEELAKGAHSFDWSIVEEAGKTHGFDLALPLQAGHRWLLLGDHKQLRPFLYDEFAACFNQLRGDDGTGGVIDILNDLGRKSGNARIIDIEWLKEKLDSDANWAKSFPNYAQRWLASFESIFEGRRKLRGITQNQSIGASAGLLTRQYRMPPVVGDLNSAVFYKGAVSNATADAQGSPDEDHRNPFVAPAWLAEKSLVWVDIPWDHDHRESRRTGYANMSERQVIQRLLRSMAVANVQSTGQPNTIAILTPYNMQKLAINNDGNIAAPAGCQFGSAQNREAGESKAKAYSVDSFQGDEADVIIVSLVRNKPTRAQETLLASNIEFIAQPDRLNVMLSRSKRLLIIVGCWEFLSACVARVSSTTDADGNYNDPDSGPFKKTFEELEAMFKDGRALKISMHEALL